MCVGSGKLGYKRYIGDMKLTAFQVNQVRFYFKEVSLSRGVAQLGR